MVGKSHLSFIILVSVLLVNLPYDIQGESTRAPDRYDLDNLPDKDENGNYSLYNNDEWDMLGEGIIDGNITLYNNSLIIIDNANVTINGNIWAKDNSEIIISSSTVRVNIPPHDPIPTDEQYDNPNGFVLIEDGASLKIGDSYVHLFRDHINQICPNGTLTPAEILVVLGKLFIKDSDINTYGNVSWPPRGIVLHMSCELNVYSSTLTSGIVFYVNSQGLIENSTVRSLTMSKNTEEWNVVISNSTITKTVTMDKVSKAMFSNCQLKSILIVKYWGEAVLQNTTIAGLRISGNGTAIMDDSEFSTIPAYPDWNDLQDNGSLMLLNSSFIKKLFIDDNSSIELIDSSMNDMILGDNAFANLTDSSLDNLSAEDNSTVWLQRSEIGQYSLKNNAMICNITTLSIGTKLNHQPLQVSVRLKNLSGGILCSLTTDELGKTEFTLIRNTISIDKTTMNITETPQITYCFVEADYENLHEEEGLDIDEDFEEVELQFEDYNNPIIYNVQFTIHPFVNTNEKVKVSAYVEDVESNLSYVILRYSINDGTTWNNISMYNIGENILENSIPGHNDGTKVRFYIIARDKCGNSIESKYYAYTVGEGVILLNNLIILTILVSIFCLLVGVVVKSLWSKMKVKRYLIKAGK